MSAKWLLIPYTSGKLLIRLHVHSHSPLLHTIITYIPSNYNTLVGNLIAHVTTALLPQK